MAPRNCRGDCSCGTCAQPGALGIEPRHRSLEELKAEETASPMLKEAS
jgi:hypothetical protein